MGDYSQPSAKISSSPSTAAIEAWLIDALAEHLAIDADDIDTTEPFAAYGIGSADAVILAGDLETWLKRDLPVTLLWDFPTIETLAQHLSHD